MIERPILFSGPMVRAILAGRKTVTRRIVKAPPWSHLFPSAGAAVWSTTVGFQWRQAVGGVEHVQPIACPYGAPGDRLWVRETWRETGSMMRADNRKPERGLLDRDTVVYRADDLDDGPWRPAIFMERAFSRLTLEVVSVRVERLHEITASDARREGIETLDIYHERVGHADAIGCGTGEIGRETFADLWGEINGKRAPWESNPWVWRVEFRPVPR